MDDASLAVIVRLGFVRSGERIDESDALEHVFARDARATVGPLREPRA